MNKKLIAVAIAAAVAAPSAMAEAIFYGKIRQSIDMIDTTQADPYYEGERQQDLYVEKDYIEIKDQTSRLGFKGSEDLGDGMKAVWQMEFGVNISNGSDEFTAASNPVSARNAFVGLAGDFGTVLVGRHDTPLKISTGSLDPFADTSADYNNAYMGGLLDLRADGTLAYISPSFSGLTVAAAVVPGENNNADGLADAWSAAAMYSNGGIFLTAAMESGDSDIDYLQSALFHPEYGPDDPDNGYYGTNFAADYDQWRVGGSYTMDAFKVGAMYANTELDDTDGENINADIDHWSIFGTYTMGNNVFKVRYFDTETDLHNGHEYGSGSGDNLTIDADGWAIGVDHNFSARTQLSLLYVNSEADMNWSMDDGDDTGTAEYNDTEIFSVQLNHSF